MKDLFDHLMKRIIEAIPNPIELSDKELALLEAMLETHRDKLCLSKIQRAKKGDREAQMEIIVQQETMEYFHAIALFNKKLKGIQPQEKKPDPTETAPDNDIKETKLTSTEELTLCQYNEAKKHIRKPNPTDAEVYEVAKAMGEEGRLSGGRITVSRTTWASYLSRARKASGQPKNNPRAKRAEGGSSNIVPYDQL